MVQSQVSLKMLVPEATVNYITNPAFRYNTTNWNTQGATLTRTLTRARFGVASGKVVTTGAALHEGIYFRVSALQNVSDPITVSVYLRGAGTVRLRLDDNAPGGGEFTSQPIFLDDERWTRYDLTGRCNGGDDLRLYVETDEAVAVARTFYVDGAQLERKGYVTSYCDGEQENCRWNGIDYASTSQRPASTRSGGHWVELSGVARAAEDLYMTVVGGLGMAPLVNDVQEYTWQTGGFHKNSRVTSRLVILTFHARHIETLQEPSRSLAHLHALRQFLIDTVKPDLTGGDEDIWFEYRDGTLPQYFRARYDGGLEGGWDVRNEFINSFPLRLLLTSPLVYEDDQEVQVLDFQDSGSAVNVFRKVAGRINGQWNNMNYGMNGSVGDLELGKRGEVVAAGAFGSVNFSLKAIDPVLVSKNISIYDGEKWLSYVTSNNGTTINDAAIAPNGDIYVTGNFTSIGGVAANRIARWDGSNWSALGVGLNNDGFHVQFDGRGRLYVGGKFTEAGGIPRPYIAFWDGSSWHGMGQFSGMNNWVNTIAITPDGSRVFIGGLFTAENTMPAGTLLRVAEYDLVTDRFSQVGDGFNNNVNELILDNGNNLHACGEFTASGARTVNRIARLEGGVWMPLGSGMNNTVLSFDVGVNGDIVAVGHFTLAGNTAASKIALWNGSTWTNIDADIAVGDPALVLLAVQYHSNGDIYIGGYWNEGTVTYSAINLVENIGSAEVHPIVYISGPGRMRWLENQTNRRRIFFDLTVDSGEEVTLDMGRGAVISSKRGKLFNSILPGSDLESFSLLPGENRIACYMTNDTQAAIQMRYQPVNWGAG